MKDTTGLTDGRCKDAPGVEQHRDPCEENLTLSEANFSLNRSWVTWTEHPSQS